MMKRFQVYLTQLQLDRLLVLAKTTGLSVAELVRRAIDEYLKDK